MLRVVVDMSWIESTKDNSRSFTPLTRGAPSHPKDVDLSLGTPTNALRSEWHIQN